MTAKKLMLLRCPSPHLIPRKLFPRLLSCPAFFSLHRTNTTSTTAVIISHYLSSSATTTTYGPSLQKGTLPSKTAQNPFLNDALKPFQITQNAENGDEPPLFDEDQFTRVFEIAAIRVPSDRCFELEARLRGHLLNWPRVSNIARVPGDEMEEEIRELLMEKKVLGNGEDEEEEEEEVSKAVSRRIYGKAEGDGEILSGVLYRDKLAKEFNARGFVKFRNLAKISRPIKRKKKGRSGGKGRGEVGEVEKGRRKRSVLVEEKEKLDGGEDLGGLLGDEYKGRKWKGSTRLLLLDETYSEKSFDELPNAVKVIFSIL